MTRNLKIAAVAAGTVALGSVLGAVAAGAQRRLCLQVIRNRGGIARVQSVTAPDGEEIRVLSQGGVYQSATYLGDRRFEPVFAYYRAFDAMFEAWPGHEDGSRPIKGVRNVLMIGGGGFAYPKHLLTAHSGIHLDVAELDLSVVRVARRWFFLDELEARLANPETARGNTLRIIEANGRALLERGEGTAGVGADGGRGGRAGSKAGGGHVAAGRFVVDGPGGALRVLREGEISLPRYDAIVNDAFLGREPARELSTVEAARAVRGRLAPGGLYLVNVVSGDGGRDLSFLRDEVATLAEVFEFVHVLQSSDAEFGGEDNYLLIATDGDAEFSEDIPYEDDFPGTSLHDDDEVTCA